MSDFRQFFDLRALDEQKLGMIEFVLNSPAYEESFKPYLQSVRDSLNTLWLDRSQQRKEQFPDDFLAGGIAAIDGLLKFFAIVVHETSIERMHESMAEMTPEIQYAQRQQAGRLKPVVGINQKAAPDKYDPAEDF